ncbi:MAG: hypothetical protein JRH11_16170 [Deltaproteobacteria bacterium]|nr:hypothetical protein [Deltaproteobacteria bacterium]
MSLEDAFAEAATGAFYVSEADYEPVFMRATPADPEAPLTSDAIGELFRAQILEGMVGSTWDEIIVELDSGDLTGDLAQLDSDEDEWMRESTEAWGRIDSLFDANLSDRVEFIVGPVGDDGNMQEDWGFYLQGVVGRTADGDVVGLFVGTVWT